MKTSSSTEDLQKFPNDTQTEMLPQGFGPSLVNTTVEDHYHLVVKELEQTIQETQEVSKRQVIIIMAIVFSLIMVIWGTTQSGWQAYFCSGIGLLITLVSGLLWNQNRKLISDGKQNIDRLIRERSHYEMLLNQR